MEDVVSALDRMSLDELRLLAKQLRLGGYSNIRKAELIALIRSSDSKALRRRLFPTWWERFHNHVYGVASVAGVILAIAFFAWPNADSPKSGSSVNQHASVRTVEKPIGFADYAAMPPAEKQSLFESRYGDQFVWEGYLSKTIGFELGTLTGVPYETPVSIQITPTRSRSPQIATECSFGEIVATDSGIELAVQLSWLTIGQRLRLSGQLGGTSENPVLKDACLEAVFPLGE